MSRVDLLNPEMLHNTYAFFADLRRNAPVCQVDPGGLWAITRYDDVLHALNTPSIFSSQLLYGILMEPPWLGYSPFCHSMLGLDPPRHTQLRALVNRAFSPSAMTKLEPLIRRLAEEFTDELLKGDTADYMSVFAVPFVSAVIGHITGLDPSLHAHFKGWTDCLSTITSIAPDDVVSQARIRSSLKEMENYVRELVESRRRQSRSDVCSELIQTRVDGQSLSDEELVSFVVLLLAAGVETTASMLGSSALWLTDHPEMFEQLRASPSLIVPFVEESMRWFHPTVGLFRGTTQEVEVRGVRIPAGAPVFLVLGSATMDEQYVPEPEKFRLDRPLQNLPLGHGVHFCLGAFLGRLEQRIALDVLLTRVRGMSRTPGPAPWKPSMNMRGLARLDVTFLRA